MKSCRDFPLRVRLPDGTTAIVRPIGVADAPWLTAGLQRLSASNRVRRFLFDKRAYTPDELERFTRFDERRHLALVLAITNAAGAEIDGVAVARCFRDPDEPAVAEFAIATVDEWQRRGIGTILVHELAAAAHAAGIRRWKAVFLTGNKPARKLLNRVARLEVEHWVSADCIEATYTLYPPRPGPPAGNPVR
jgi:GNAT superfamily N-acetyltransferase